MKMGACEFRFDPRLGIHLPHLEGDWDDLGAERQAAVIAEWEQIRGRIPERIKELERRIEEKQERMNDEDDFAACCRLNWEIAELASAINDLNIWFRIRPEISGSACP